MNPYKHHTLDELLLAPLNEEVFDRILEILNQKQRTSLGSQRAWGATEKPHMLFRLKIIGRPRGNTVAMPVTMDAN